MTVQFYYDGVLPLPRQTEIYFRKFMDKSFWSETKGMETNHEK